MELSGSAALFSRLRLLIHNAFQPFLVRAEVNKTAVTHYFKPDKARRELGYQPLISAKDAMQQVIDWQLRLGTYVNRRKQQQQQQSSSWRVLLLVAVLVIAFLLFRRVFA